jgi:hypothetical protein
MPFASRFRMHESKKLASVGLRSAAENFFPALVPVLSGEPDIFET